MSQQLGNEVYRKARQGKQVNYTQDSSEKKKSCPMGGIQTHDTLQSR